MIVEFSVKNFRSIKELQTISFAATGLTSLDPEVDVNNIAEEGDKRLLKTVGIYGANASGKSNIIRAFEYFLQAIRNEPSSQSNLNHLCDPFLYQENVNETESFFQIVLLLKNKKYRYGFTVKRSISNMTDEIGLNTTDFVIKSEWLFGTREKNMVEYFIKNGKNEISKEKMLNNEKIPPLPYEHTLFLTHSAAYDNEGDCVAIRNYIVGWTASNLTLGLSDFRRISLSYLDSLNKKNQLLHLLNTFNLKYDDIDFEKDQDNPKNLNVPHEKIFLTKAFLDNNNKLRKLRLNLKYNESEGTNKIFDLAGVLLAGFNSKNGVFILIDEIDSNFHPSLLIKLIELFNNPLINKSNSQLLFTSHDTNLLAPSILRRDQIYFAEKREDESTRLFSLAELKGVLKGADFAKQYLAGFYGALPILGDYLTENTSQND